MSFYCPYLDAECRNHPGSFACEECPYFNEKDIFEV